MKNLGVIFGSNGALLAIGTASSQMAQGIFQKWCSR